MTAQTILPANSVVSGGYDVANSCRFNDGSSDHMLKTAAAGSRRIFTFSTWFKRGQLGTNQQFFTSYSAGNAGGFAYMQLEAPESGVIGDRISLEVYGTILLKTNQVLRDPSSWYNLVIAVDTTNATANNRCRMYLNGTEITSFATRNNPDENFDFAYNQDSIDLVLASNNYNDTKGNYFDGYLAETVWIDGTQYAASDFGEFDDSGIWKPVDVSGLTFGTNGFYLDYEASGNLGNDANGGTDLTEANLTAVDQSTDTCTNNFATLNPLNNYWAAATFSEGNLVYTSNNTEDYYGIATSTIGVASGKWYFEAKTSTASGQDILGITSKNMTGRTTWLGSRSQEYGYYQDSGTIRSNAGGGGSDTSYGQAYTVNDIIGIYMDLDNNKMYVSDNGVLMNSGTGHTITAASLTDSGFYHFAVGDNSDSTQVWQCNFGGTSGFAISSAVTDDNGFGAFEYSPNITGDSVAKKFYALCSKNLAEYG